MKTYIYTLSHPISKEVRYIGKTNNIAKRFANHLTTKNKTHCNSWIKSLIKIDLIPIIEIIDEIEDKEWQWLEQYWIEQFRQWGFNLVNHTIGGEGLYGYKASIQTKTKMSSAHKGKKLSSITKEKLSKLHRNKVINDDHKEKISKALKEYYLINKHHIKDYKRGTCNNKLTSEQVLNIRKLLLMHQTVYEIAKKYKVSKSTIQQIKSGKTWQSLGEFKIEGKAPILKKDDLKILYNLFDNGTKVKDIQKVLPYCIATIAKQRKIWKKIKI